jgi:hypothetical protein
MNPYADNIRPASVEIFYILDFDRCLGRPDAFSALLEKVLEDVSVVDPQIMRRARQQVEKTGGSFDNAHFIRQVLTDRQQDVDVIWAQIEAAFCHAAAQQDVFEPYAKELIDTLNVRHDRYGILTFGGQQWQTLKIKGAGLLQVPHMIVSNKAKGRLIASWRQSDGTFIIPAPLAGDQPVRAKRLVFVDDKLISFDGIPKEVIGVCVSPQATSDEIAALPPNVKVVKGMAQATTALADAS